MPGFPPKIAPGMTQSEMTAALRAALSPEQFPGTTSSGWMKAVQLDQEAKSVVVVRRPSRCAGDGLTVLPLCYSRSPGARLACLTQLVNSASSRTSPSWM
jgi:hypothetical protein